MWVKTVGSLFSGIGGIELGFKREGFTTKWFVENDDYCQQVLRKHWPSVPIYGDIRTVDFSRLERVDILTGASPARTSAPQIRKAKALKAREAGCGLITQKPFAYYDPSTQSLRTYQTSLIKDLTLCLGILPKSGTMRNGILYLREELEQDTFGGDCSSWPTPKAQNANGPGQHGQGGQDLQTMVQMWPTPTATERENDITAMPSEGTIERYQKGEINLIRKTRAPTLTTAAKIFPTPQARDWKGASQRGSYSEGAKDCLPNALRGIQKESGELIRQTWPTPRANTAMSATITEEADENRYPNLETALKKNYPEVVGGQLNPMWVEWLMGFPRGWTDLDVSETQSCHRSPKSSREESEK